MQLVALLYILLVAAEPCYVATTGMLIASSCM